MARRVVIEEYHLTVLVPRALAGPEAEAVRRTLADPAFLNRLRRAIRVAFRREATLGEAKVRLSR